MTRQAVWGHAKKGQLKKTPTGKIDIDEPQNRQFLEDREGVNWSVFDAPNGKSAAPVAPVTTPTPTPVEHPGKRRNQHDPQPGQEPSSLDRLSKLAKLKRQTRETDILELKLASMKRSVFSSDVVTSIFAGFTGRTVSTIGDISASVADRILALRVTNPDDEREQLVRLLTHAYTVELKAIVAEFRKKYGLPAAKDTDK